MRKLKVKLILPALTEATSPYWRPIKYSLFPPLGLATLAGSFNADDEIEIIDEHVEKLDFNDKPDLVVMQVYITSAYRAREIANNYKKIGVHVAVGGLHVTALISEALEYADSVFIGPSDDTWRIFINDFRNGVPKRVYFTGERSFNCIPEIRRDLIKRHLYLVPNSTSVSRGCPHNCAFCYKHSYYRGGKSFYTNRIESAIKDIERLPGKHLFFLDDNFFADQPFAMSLLDELANMKRIWQAAASVSSLSNEKLLDKAAEAGLKSLFIGFETLNSSNLKTYNKNQNQVKQYGKVIKNLHDRSIMINASFVFGMDHDDTNVFDTTDDWAISQGIETATFHILTPYPGTDLYARLKAEGRMLNDNWNLYDTRHSVFSPSRMTPEQLEAGYWRAYEKFYSWRSIISGSLEHTKPQDMMRHFFYSAGWKKFETMWHFIIKLKRLNHMIPVLETILSGEMGAIVKKKVNNAFETSHEFQENQYKQAI